MRWKMSLADKFYTVLGSVFIAIFSIIAVTIFVYVVSGILSMAPGVVWSIAGGFLLIHLLKKN